MADISTNMADWSGTAGNNLPSGGTPIASGLDDNLRAIEAAVVLALQSKGSDIASDTTVDLSATNGLFHDVTGTSSISSFGTVRAGVWKVLKFEGALTLTHNATSLILPGAANITTADKDIAMVVSEGSGNWRCVFYQRAALMATVSGTETLTNKTLTAPTLGGNVTLSGLTASRAVATDGSKILVSMDAPITSSISGDVTLNNTAAYFTGPTISQGTSGTWFVSGVITALSTAAAANFHAKLWDGTTVIASSAGQGPSANSPCSISLSGFITNPAADLRISVKDASTTSGLIKADYTGGAKDSTITAIRIF